jgi:hypothetical protein
MKVFRFSIVALFTIGVSFVAVLSLGMINKASFRQYLIAEMNAAKQKRVDREGFKKLCKAMGCTSFNPYDTSEYQAVRCSERGQLFPFSVFGHLIRYLIRPIFDASGHLTDFEMREETAEL